MLNLRIIFALPVAIVVTVGMFLGLSSVFKPKPFEEASRL